MKVTTLIVRMNVRVNRDYSYFFLLIKNVIFLFLTANVQTTMSAFNVMKVTM